MNRLRKNVMSLWKDRTLILMALPAVIILILFSYVPMTGLVLAFKKFDYSLGLYASPWCGFENFKQIFLVGDTFWRITRNTVGYYVLFTLTGVICEIALAIGISELSYKKAGKYLHSTIILPTFISAVALQYIVNAFLNSKTGMLNHLIVALGGKSINFYLEAGYWPLILTIVNLWINAGYGSILYLSALSGIDPELNEAAALDGATRWQRIRYITLPMLIPMASIKLLLGLGSIMHSNTGLFYQVTKNSGALYSTTQVLDSYVLNAIQTSGNFGSTAAVTFYQSVIGCLMMVVVNLIVKKISPENSLF